jgi:uncharacterized protein YjbJ (UPF0337 family)
MLSDITQMGRWKMNKDIIQGKWKEIKGKIRQQWSEFTEDDVGHMKGTFEELAGALQKKYGYQKDRAEKEIEKFIDKHHWH